MKIIDKGFDTPFEDVKPGTAFYYEDVLFMRMVSDCLISDKYEKYNAVRLDDGVCIYMGQDMKVKIAKVHIENDKE